MYVTPFPSIYYKLCVHNPSKNETIKLRHVSYIYIAKVITVGVYPTVPCQILHGNTNCIIQAIMKSRVLLYHGSLTGVSFLVCDVYVM